jgi:hypothetical protein
MVAQLLKCRGDAEIAGNVTAVGFESIAVVNDLLFVFLGFEIFLRACEIFVALSLRILPAPDHQSQTDENR